MTALGRDDREPASKAPAEVPVAADRRSRFGLGLYAAHLFSLFSLAASNILLGVSLLAAPWTVRGGRPLSREARRWVWCLGLYVVLKLVSVALSYDPRISAGSLGEIFNLTSPLLALLLIRRERDARRIVKLVILLAALLAALGLVQYLLGNDDLQSRIRGSLSHYMTFAGVLLIGDCLLLAWIACGDGRRRLWAWVALAAINLALLGSYTRNAWVALLVVVTVLVVVRAPKFLWAYLPVTALLLVLVPQPMLSRFVSIADLHDPSNYDRLCMVSAGLDMVKERPIFGIGPAMVSRRYTIYRHPTAPRFWVPHLHNSYLNLAAERGLVSLAAFLALLGLSARQAWRRLRLEGGLRGPRADLFLGVLLVLLGFCVAALFEDNWADAEVQRVLVFVLALPFCFLEEKEVGREERAPPPVL